MVQETLGRPLRRGCKGPFAPSPNLVDVSDIFYFFLGQGRGRGSPGQQGGGGGFGFLLKIRRRGGGVLPKGGGVRGAGRVSAGNLGGGA